MRLLHFDDTGRVVSTDFSEKVVPPYAILSHRWDDDEVFFEDLVRSRHQSKTGYRKIEFCAKRAVQDGLRYFWIDTCCIDKWNLQERSKAINSMFRWYRDATKCYVFLSDVSVTTTDVRQPSTWEASFRASKWFTRGWTLQELIAPKWIEFYSLEGCRLGDKGSLEQLVQEITRIPVEVLQGCALENFSVPDRIAWAGSRGTTEQEDSAYCLLGILNVHMPTSYGEGKQNALRRLYDELEATGTAVSVIPFFQNLQFVGRESQLAELEAKLFVDKQTTMTAITGTGGAGKSQLALELAYRTKRRNKSCSVFWVDASDMDSLHQAYSNFAQKLDIPGWNDEKADVKQLLRLYLSGQGAGQWLLILDNVDDVNLKSTVLSTSLSTNLMDYLPQSEVGSVIVTTTNSDIVRTLAIRNVTELQGMELESAQRMLENYIPCSTLTSEKQEVKLLLEELSYLPLAIVQAVAYIRIQDITLKDYRSRLVKQREAALEQGYSTESAVATTLLVSLDQIRYDHSLAANYLYLAACVDRKDIPLDLLEAASSRERETAIGALSVYRLITRRPAASALDLHRLVHLAIRKWLQNQRLLDQWIRKAVGHLLKVFSDNDHQSRSRWRRLLPHANYALSCSVSEQDDEDRTTLRQRCAMALFSDGRYNESEELFVSVMEIYKTKLGTDHPDTLTSINNLALTYTHQGRWTEAEQLQVQVMNTRKTELGADHPNTLNSMSNLALTYSNQSRWAKAEQLQIQVMETRKTKLGTNHPDTLISMDSLAIVLKKQGQDTQAIRLMRDCAQRSSRNLGATHPRTLSSLKALSEWKIGHHIRSVEFDHVKRERCDRCLKFGHPTSSCREKPRCSYCAGEHERRKCFPGVASRCIDCGEAHATGDRACGHRYM